MVRKPRYPSDSDYTTNAPSYYDDLARKQKLIKELSLRIWKYDKTLAESLENIENVLNEYINVVDGKLEIIDNVIGEGFDNRIEILLREWVNDGTLDHIINEEIFNTKVDKSVFEEVTSKFERVVNAEIFGVSTDPEFDNAPAIKSIIDYVKNNQDNVKVWFPDGRYYIKNNISEVIPEGTKINIEGNNVTFFSKQDEKDNPHHIIEIKVNSKKTTNVVYSIEADQYDVIVDNVDGFEKGDLVKIKTLEPFSIRENNDVHYKQHISRIFEINGKVIRLTDPFPYKFNDGNSIQMENLGKPTSVNFNGISFEWIETNSTTATSSLRLENISNSNLKNLYFKGHNNTGIRLVNCYNTIINGIKAEGSDNHISLNYSISISGGNHIKVLNSNLTSTRHPIVLTGSPVQNFLCQNSELYSKVLYSFDSHCSWSCKLINCYLPNGIQIAGGHFDFIDCDIRNRYDTIVGIRIRTDYEGFNSIKIKGGNFTVDSNISSRVSLLEMSISDRTKHIGDITIDSFESDGSKAQHGLRYISFLDVDKKKLNKVGNLTIINSFFKGEIEDLIYTTTERPTTDKDGKEPFMANERGTILIENNLFDSGKLDRWSSDGWILFKTITMKNNRPFQVLKHNDPDYNFNGLTLGYSNQRNVTMIFDSNFITDEVIIESCDNSLVFFNNNKIMSSSSDYFVKIRQNNNTHIEAINNTMFHSNTANNGILNSGNGSEFFINNRFEGNPENTLLNNRISNVANDPFHLISRNNLIITGNGEPTIAPFFLGQLYIDLDSGYLYFGRNLSGSGGWKKLSNA